MGGEISIGAAGAVAEAAFMVVLFLGGVLLGKYVERRGARKRAAAATTAAAAAADK